MKKAVFFLLTSVVLCSGCGTIEYQPDWIDSPDTRDASFDHPDYLVSARPAPSADAEFDKPVIIAVHGFTASTYEWEEFRAFAEDKGTALVSLVLLGGHGTSVEDFAKTTWRDWQKPVIDEYNALKAMGYRNISFVAASMGCALTLEAVMNSRIDPDGTLNQLIFIDPFILPTDKNLYLIDLMGAFITNVPYRDATEEEKKHSYVNRPSATLRQLKSLVRKVEDQVLKGYTLPPGVGLTVYKAKVDEAASPENAVFLQEHIRLADGTKPEIHMVDSDKHVFTRLQGRAAVTEKDRRLQVKTFDEILGKVMK
jgi:carboxylesterase